MIEGSGSRPGRGLALVGCRGSGKTTVGRIVAESLGLPFFDCDRVVEARSGRGIPELFAESGETAFRDWEERVLADLCARHPEAVLATGGGAVLRRANRERIREHGRVVWLKASPLELARRIALDAETQRPALTSAGVIDEIECVLAERTPLYAAIANDAIDATDSPPEEVARTIIARWPR